MPAFQVAFSIGSVPGYLAVSPQYKSAQQSARHSSRHSGSPLAGIHRKELGAGLETAGLTSFALPPAKSAAAAARVASTCGAYVTQGERAPTMRYTMGIETRRHALNLMTDDHKGRCGGFSGTKNLQAAGRIEGDRFSRRGDGEGHIQWVSQWSQNGADFSFSPLRSPHSR